MIPAQFHGVGQLLQRLGVPLPPPLEAYRIRFARETSVYVVFRPQHWLELLAPAGGGAGIGGATAAALLQLDARQVGGILLCTSMDERSGALTVRARVPLEACHADLLIEALERLRGHAASVQSLLFGSGAATMGGR